MKTNITYTSTLSADLIKWIEQYSKASGTTKKNLIENALKHYRNHLKQTEMKTGFKKAAQDLEIQNMAEEGLTDYLDQLNTI